MATKKKLEKYQNPGTIGYSWSRGQTSGNTVVPSTRTDELRENQKDINERQEKINKVAKSILDSKGIDDFTDEDIDVLSQSTVPNVTKVLRDYRINRANKAQEKDGAWTTAEGFKESTAALGDKLSAKRIFGENFPDVLDATGGIGQMSAGLGAIPSNLQQGQYGQAALNLGLPLLTGALSGLGTTSRGQFLNNLVNPLPSLSILDKVKNLPNSIKGTIDLMDQSVGELVQGSANRRSISEGNKWLEDWINHSSTQDKIRNDFYDYGAPLDEAERLMYRQSKKFKPISKEYSLKNQLKDNIDQYKGSTEGYIHDGNYGVSYLHNEDPYTRDFVFNNPELINQRNRKGSWISRSPEISQANRKSTTIHEGTHDWVSDAALSRSSQKWDILDLYKKETQDNFFEWDNLQRRGENPNKVMGTERATKAYYADPTEMHARVMELRHELNLKPDQYVTPKEASEIIDLINKGKSKVSKKFLDPIDSSPDKLSKLFNRLWGTVPASTVGTAGLSQQNEEQDTPQYQQGGATTDNMKKKKLEKYQNSGPVKPADFTPSVMNTFLQGMGLFPNVSNPTGNAFGNSEFGNTLNQKVYNDGKLLSGIPGIQGLETPLGEWGDDVSKKNQIFLQEEDNKKYGTNNIGAAAQAWALETGQDLKGNKLIEGYMKNLRDRSGAKYDADVSAQKGWNEYGKPLAGYMSAMNNLTDLQAVENLKGNKRDLYDVTDEMKGMENKGIFAKEGGVVKNMQLGGAISQMSQMPQISQLQQALGYKDNSPFKNMLSQIINSNRITMDGVSQPLQVTADTGERRVLPPNSGIHVFPGAQSVLERPAVYAQDGASTNGVNWSMYSPHDLSDVIADNKKTIGGLNRSTSTLKAHKDIDATNSGVTKRMVEDVLRIENLKRQEKNGGGNELTKKIIKLYESKNYKEALNLAEITDEDVKDYTDKLLAVSDLMNEYGVESLKPTVVNRLSRIIGRDQSMFDPSSNTIYANSLGNVISELTHAKQKKDGRNLATSVVKDWVKDPYITSWGHADQYNTPGTMEYEAHKVIEPQLKDEVENKMKRFSGIFQQGGSVTPSLRKRIYDIVGHEKKQGGIKGNSLPGAGIKGKSSISDDEAVDYIIENYLPKVKGLNTEDEIIAALDMQYNGGKDVRVLAYQEWLKTQDPNNTTGWMDKYGKWKDRNNPPPNFDELYNKSLGKLKDEERLNWIDKGRDWYYKNIWQDNPTEGIGAGVGYWGRTKNPDPNKDYYLAEDGYYYERGKDGSLSPGYGKTWSGRLIYTKPKKAAATSTPTKPQQPISQPQIQQTTTSPQTQTVRAQQSTSTQPTNINQQRQNADPSKIRHINQPEQFIPQTPKDTLSRRNDITGGVDWSGATIVPSGGLKFITAGPNGKPMRGDSLYDFYDKGDGTYVRRHRRTGESVNLDYGGYLRDLAEDGVLTWKEIDDLEKNKKNGGTIKYQNGAQVTSDPTTEYNYLTDFEKLQYVKTLKGYVEKYGFESLVYSDPKGAAFLQEQLELLSKGDTDPKDPPVEGGNPVEGEDIVITAKRDKEKSNAEIPPLRRGVIESLLNPAQLPTNDNLFKDLIEGFKEQKSAAQREQEYKRKLQLMFAEQNRQKEQVGSNISTGRGRFQSGGIPILNLSKNINPMRLNPQGIYKMGGLITEGGEYDKREQPTKNPISGASSTGPMGPKDIPSYDGGIRSVIDQEKNQIIPTENLIPIQTEKGELIVLPTGDVVPVMAKKRHHQMDEDEVTDVAPEGAYILSAFGRVKIKKSEAEKVITETGVKPYKLGIGQETPTEKTLGDLMTKNQMTPAEIGKIISQKFPVIATDNPYEAAANTENKINRKPYLEGLIQLSEFDKMRKGIDTSTPEATREYSDSQDEGMDMETEEMMNGGNPMFRDNISHAPIPLAVLIPAISGLIQAGTSIFGASQQKKSADQAYRDVLRLTNQSADKQRGQLGLGAAAGILGTLSQDPTVNAVNYNPTYINQMQTRTPMQITDSIANSAFANMPTYSNLAPQQQMMASQAAWGQALKAAGDARMNAWAGDRTARNQQLTALQGYSDKNEESRIAAQNATRLNRNQQIGNVGDRTQGYFDSTATIEANLGQTQANARLGQGSAQQQAIRSYTQGINQAIGTAGAAAYDYYSSNKPPVNTVMYAPTPINSTPTSPNPNNHNLNSSGQFNTGCFWNGIAWMRKDGNGPC